MRPISPQRSPKQRTLPHGTASGGQQQHRGGGRSSSGTSSSSSCLRISRSGPSRKILFGTMVFCLGVFLLLPLFMLETMDHKMRTNGAAAGGVLGGTGGGHQFFFSLQQQQQVYTNWVHDLMLMGGSNAQLASSTTTSTNSTTFYGAGISTESINTSASSTSRHPPVGQEQEPQDQAAASSSLTSSSPRKNVQQKQESVLLPVSSSSNTATNEKMKRTNDGRFIRNIQFSELIPDLITFMDKPLARGVAGLPMNQTPALIGGKRAHIQQCEINIDSLAYWNNPPGTYDQSFTSPFAVTPKQPTKGQEKYITFSADSGGWNNIRMSMEIIFIIAAATNRILVLPPKETLYLLHHDKGNKYRGYGDFFPIHTKQFEQYIQIITFQEFIQRQVSPIPMNLTQAIERTMDHCEHGSKTHSCKFVEQYLRGVGYNVPMNAQHVCLIFDQGWYDNGQMPIQPTQDRLNKICGPHRKITYWGQEMDTHKVIHFRASEADYRLLAHFYGVLFFTDPILDNHFKRFVRDQLHYHDPIYCAAGKIVKALQLEGIERGFQVDDEGAGGYSALHVRRGDLQYKAVKIPANEWYENTKEVWLPKEILYVATDERNKSFFDDIQKHHDLRYLDDYWDLAGLKDLDPNYMGMIDTIVASRGRAFAGTWFSTFSGYINRLRGYHGISMMNSWSSYLPKKSALHEWKKVDFFAFAFEWQDGWIGIDGNEFPAHDKF